MTEQDIARRIFEEWGVPSSAASQAVDRVVAWWRTADEGALEPAVLLFNTRGDLKEVGGACFLEQFGVDLDRLAGNVIRG